MRRSGCDVEGERVINIPNAITVVRIVLTALFAMVHFACPERRILSISLFILAGFTDCLDGMAARRLGQITKVGKLLDPLADKVMILVSLICLWDAGAVSLLVIILIAAKEAYMFIGAGALLRHSVVIPADKWGKASTLLFIAAFIFLYPWHGVSILNKMGAAIMYASVSCSLFAALHYTGAAVKKSRILKTD